jgi:hypothetical protein
MENRKVSIIDLETHSTRSKRNTNRSTRRGEKHYPAHARAADFRGVAMLTGRRAPGRRIGKPFSSALAEIVNALSRAALPYQGEWRKITEQDPLGSG